jgi:monoamine oxidase
MSAGEMEDGTQLMVGFLCEQQIEDVEAAIRRAVELSTPGAEIVAWDTHSWIDDPFSKGAWAGYKPGRLSSSHSLLRRPEGRLSFATADIGLRYICYFEAAIETGRRAAAQAAEWARTPIGTGPGF